MSAKKMLLLLPAFILLGAIGTLIVHPTELAKKTTAVKAVKQPASMPTSRPFPSQVVIRSRPEKKIVPGTIDFPVNNQWGCNEVTFTTDWNQTLTNIAIVEKPGVRFTVWPDKIEVETSSGPITLTREHISWTLWKGRYLELRSGALSRPAK